MGVLIAIRRIKWTIGSRLKVPLGSRWIAMSSVLLLSVVPYLRNPEPEVRQQTSLLAGRQTQDADERPRPSDFLVSDEAFDTLRLAQFGGNWFVESITFSDWLRRNGDFGLLVALNDKRPIPASGEDIPLDDNEPENDLAQPIVVLEMRVCDMAYQLSYEAYGLSRMSYRDNYDKRQTLINELISKLNKSAE